MARKPKVRILRMRRVPFVDATGAHNLSMMAEKCRAAGIVLVLSGVRDEVHETLEKSGIAAQIGEENICRDIHLALQHSHTLLQAAPIAE